MSAALATVPAPLPISPLANRPLKAMPEWIKQIFSHMGKFTHASGLIETTLATLPTPAQRAEIVAMRDALIAQLEQTPEDFPQLEQEMLVALGELMLAKPYRATDGHLRAEATVRSFRYALGDVPVWATLRAIRNWHRGEVESYLDPNGTYNCRWMPDPTELRRIAKRYAREVEQRVHDLNAILNATEVGAPQKPVVQIMKSDRRDDGPRQVGAVLDDVIKSAA